MKLNRFQYWEQGDAGEDWKIEGLVFDQFNLVVGRNATGKTRLLKAISRAAGEVSGDLRSSTVAARFELVLPDVRDLSDFPGAKNAQGAELTRFRSEATAEWGRRAQYYPFAGRMTFKTPASRGFTRWLLPDAYQHGVETIGRDFRARVLDWLEQAGYKMADIKVEQAPAGGVELSVREANRSAHLPLRRLSQGQQRTVTLLTYLALLVARKKMVTVLIDDFAEGLDFEHAQLLARFLLKHCAQWPIQFIIATNDRYVMNTVPLEHWTILVEAGNTIRVFNYANSKKKFDDFKFTGLNNFDFFSMDFARDAAG